MADRAEQAGLSSEDFDRREMVLIIEDDPGVARLEEKRLRRAGFEVRSTGSAAEGLDAIRGGGIDLILLDQKLQGDISGLDFYERLRGSGDQTPAILVTGLNDEATLIRAVRGGLSDFVLKTDDFLDDLDRAVERVVSQIRTRRKLAESEERLAGVTLLAEAIPQIVWTARPDGNIDYAQPQMVRVFRPRPRTDRGMELEPGPPPRRPRPGLPAVDRMRRLGGHLRDRVPHPPGIGRCLSLVPRPRRAGQG